ncbi:unnamed protein product [Blepharisma stoltei]|uniref:non-specific serine/threonine protein kinase n=1 Tax=Blepharisma stoltei TaxID=1481888 RepID=A0AAU9JWD1_9CILI|nr:unnamed protein product [Blepharisma stoltei]
MAESSLSESGEIRDESSSVVYDDEEEPSQDYRPGGYHPIMLGDIFLNRYEIVQKVGWGHFSTVWLCKDLKYNTFVALKVQKSASHYTEAAYDEIDILLKISTSYNDPLWLASLKHYYEGTSEYQNAISEDGIRDHCFVVQLLNSFMHAGPNGKHICMVFEILGVNLLEIIKVYNYKGIPIPICRVISKQVLIALDYLHRICGIIHTDLKPENVLLQLTKAQINEIIKFGILKNKIDCQGPTPRPPETPITEMVKEIREIKEEEKDEKLERKKEKRKKYRQRKKEKEKQLKNQQIEKNNEDTPAVPKKKRKRNKKKKGKKEENQEENIKSENNGTSHEVPKFEEFTFENGEKIENKEIKPLAKFDIEIEEPSDAIEKPNNSEEINAHEEELNQIQNDLLHVENTKEEINDSKDESELSLLEDSSTDFKQTPVVNEFIKVKIADLGNACWIHKHFSTEIQTRQYRSPEVILGISYNYTADVWSFACMLFELITGDFLFDPRTGPDFDKEDDHLAQMVETLGFFSKPFALSGANSKKFFDHRGKLRRVSQLKLWPLKAVLMEKYRIQQHEAHMLTDFLLPMLIYEPEKRCTAQQALDHPWLKMPPDNNYRMTEKEYWETSLVQKQKEVDNNEKLKRGESPDLEGIRMPSSESNTDIEDNDEWSNDETEDKAEEHEREFLENVEYHEHMLKIKENLLGKKWN